MTKRIPLGRSRVLVSPLGLGTNTWGRAGRPRLELRNVFQAALSNGIALLDTAEIYAAGGSERSLGEFLTGLDSAARPAVLSKFFPMPWRFRKTQLVDALRRSLERLRLSALDVYLIHFPWGPRPIEAWVDALADAANAGLVRAVGVSNYNAAQVRRAYRVLDARGIPLACNEVELSLARRGAEKSGTLAACRELGVSVIAYRPLARGRLVASPVPARGMRGLMASGMRPGKRLEEVVKEIGKAHGGKTAAQVALNWVICKGAVPIPCATRISHLMENIGALGWQLSDVEVSELDSAAA